MKRFFSLLSILLLISNLFIPLTFASVNVNFSSMSFKQGSGSAKNYDIESKPGEIYKIYIDGNNNGDNLSNPNLVFNFSSNNIVYNNPNNISTYVNFATVNSNVDTSIFNPPSLNSLPISDLLNTGDYFTIFYFDLLIPSDFSDEILNISSRISSNEGTSSSIQRNIYVDVLPHITDYYFEKNGTLTTSLKRGGDQVDFFIEVTDFNGCSNIDSANVTADLSKIGLSTNETLNFDSCSGNVAKYKKSGITTILLPQSVSFSSTDFNVVDEDGNNHKDSDSNTSFDDINKTSNITLNIESAGTPTVSYNEIDFYIGGDLNDSALLNFSSDQNGEYKVVANGDSTCDTGDIVIDWQTGYVAGNNIDLSINRSFLNTGNNTINICFKNDEGVIGSTNFNVEKDITAPISDLKSFSPGNVINENVEINFSCSEDGEYEVRKTTGDDINTGTFIGSGSILALAEKQFTIDNSYLDLDNNTIKVFCLDDAKNYSSSFGNVNKTTLPPSMSSVKPILQDIDIDFEGLDGRDIYFSFDNSLADTYPYFSSFLTYLIPSNTSLDVYNNAPIKVFTDKTINEYYGDINLTKDSLGNDLVGGTSYKLCVNIFGSNGRYGAAGCSDATELVGDTVTHPNIISAKFTSDTNLELTSDATLHTDLSSHSGTLISYEFNSSTYFGKNIVSVDGKKINVEIDSLGGITNPTGLNLSVAEFGLRAEGGGFNNNISGVNIDDGISPNVSNISINTTFDYGNFYKGNINISYNFSENMKNGDTYILFQRVSGNSDSSNHRFNLSATQLESGLRNVDINLDNLDLVSGTTYSLTLIGKDLNGNNLSENIGNISYDNLGADKVIINEKTLYSTLTPEVSWNNSLDNSGNGSGVKEYILNLYNGETCQGSVLQTYNQANNSKILGSLNNVSDYSFTIDTIDNLSNTGTTSDCSSFRVDTTVPEYINSKITDLDISSNEYLIGGNNIEVTSNITGTNISNIQADLSFLTGDSNDTNVSCETPRTGITCSFSGGLLKYSFVSSNSLNDGVKQISITSNNTSGGNPTSEYISITSDSNAPVINLSNLISPTGIVGSENIDILWDNTKITDTIGIKDIKISYSYNSGYFIDIGTINNTGNFSWDTNGLSSSNDYKIKFEVSDFAGNISSNIFPSFSIDLDKPTITTSTILSPNGGEIFNGNNDLDITWNNSEITDSNLGTNPISLEYSLDGGNNWINIASNLENTGNYTWVKPGLNSSNVILKIIATDLVGNTSEDISNSSFIIDSIKPNIDFNYSSTPPHGSYINNSGFDLGIVSSDNYLEKVYYKLENTTDGTFFDGSNFSSSGTWIEICEDSVNLGESNNCNNINTTINSIIESNKNYSLSLKASDEAGNENESLVLDYIGDNSLPNITINNLDNSYFKDSININGNSSDDISGISSVKLQITRDGKYWNGSDFVSGEYSLNTNTSNSYSSWDYDFIFSGDDGNIEVKAITYDKSFKVNNFSSGSISIIKDGTSPIINGGTNLFISPELNDIFIGGDNININWNTGYINDDGSGFETNFIDLEYFDGTTWNTIVSGISDSGTYAWNNIPQLDYDNVKIRIKATDKVGNVSYQSGNGFIIDSTPPSLDSLETMDLDANGEIDGLLLTFSESIKDSTINLSDFTISSGIGTSNSWETGNSPDDNKIILKFTNTLDTGSRPSLSYSKGSITDIAGKNMESFSSFSSTDNSVPRIISSEMLDNNENGKFDLLEVTFSENIQYTTNISNVFINNIIDGLSISGVSISGNKASFTLNESNIFNTYTENMTLDFNQSSSWIDYSGNNVAGVSEFNIDDSAKPVLLTGEYLDTDNNYKTDKVLLKYSENISNFDILDFSLNGLNLANGNLNGKEIELNITETTSDNDTGINVSLDFVGGKLSDINGNLVSSVSLFNIDDKVSPKILNLESIDSNNNGKIDGVRVLFSEDINSDFNGFNSELEGYNISNINKGQSNELLITVDEKELYDGDLTPGFRVLSNTSLSDTNGNLINTFNFVGIEDKVGPVIIGARYDSSNNKIYLEFSENINSSDFIAGNINLLNAGSYSISGVNFSEKSITLSNENIDYSNTQISFDSNSVRDLNGNSQNTTSYVYISAPIVINEVMISNNQNDNYVEILNRSNTSVDISGYTIAGITIPSSTTIGANGYYLISKSNNSNNILSVIPDLVDSNLDLSGSSLVLNNGYIDIDYANINNYLNDLSTPKAIERKSNLTNGNFITSWYQSQTSIGFDNTIPKGTPGFENVYDSTSPIITNTSLNDNILLPSGNFNVKFNYEDNIGGLGIDSNNINVTNSKWNGSSWIPVSDSYIKNQILGVSEAVYTFRGLDYGKYKLDFVFGDIAGNTTTKSIVYYVDRFEYTINTNTIDFGKIKSGLNNISNQEVEIQIKTLGAGYNIDLEKAGLINNNGVNIIDWDGSKGFGIDVYNSGYDGIPENIGSEFNIVNENININTNGEQNTYTYKFRYILNVDVNQSAGKYSIDNFIDIKLDY